MSSKTVFATQPTKYERVRVIGARAEQISQGATPTVDTTGLMNPVDIAEKEYREGKLPIIIIRKLPTGGIEELKVGWAP